MTTTLKSLLIGKKVRSNDGEEYRIDGVLSVGEGKTHLKISQDGDNRIHYINFAKHLDDISIE